VYLRNNPTYVDAVKERDASAALLKSIRNGIGHCIGFLKVLDHVCAQHVERCVSHVQAAKQMLSMASHFSGINNNR
jgi:hypothetical protein